MKGPSEQPASAIYTNIPLSALSAISEKVGGVACRRRGERARAHTHRTERKSESIRSLPLTQTREPCISFSRSLVHSQAVCLSVCLRVVWMGRSDADACHRGVYVVTNSFASEGSFGWGCFEILKNFELLRSR